MSETMLRLKIRLRDWWRGYTNEDLASALRKTESRNYVAGEVLWLSHAEFAVLMEFSRGLVSR